MVITVLPKTFKRGCLFCLVCAEYSLEDSDLEGLSDITVSSVHTSDLSSFEEESDATQTSSDSSEEGELPDGMHVCLVFCTTSFYCLSIHFFMFCSQWTSTDEGERAKKKEANGDVEEKQKPRRKAYVHKPFLYSRYYSDSDDEVTVEERRRSAVSCIKDFLYVLQYI